MSQFLQAWFAAIDTLGLCLFPSLACLDTPTARSPAQAAAAVLGRSRPRTT